LPAASRARALAGARARGRVHAQGGARTHMCALARVRARTRETDCPANTQRSANRISTVRLLLGQVPHGRKPFV